MILFLVGVLLGVVFGSVIGGMLLRAAIALYNKMLGGARSTAGVPEPTMENAMWVGFVITIVNGIASITANFFGLGKAALLIGLVVSLIAMAWMLSALLPTTFRRGILLSVLCAVIAFVISVPLVELGIVAFR